jgi:hypothetical protein
LNRTTKFQIRAVVPKLTCLWLCVHHPDNHQNQAQTTQTQKDTPPTISPGTTGPYHPLHIRPHTHPPSQSSESKGWRTCLSQCLGLHLLYHAFILLMQRKLVRNIFKTSLFQGHMKFMLHPPRSTGLQFVTQNWRRFCHLHYLLEGRMTYAQCLKYLAVLISDPSGHGQNPPKYPRSRLPICRSPVQHPH